MQMQLERNREDCRLRVRGGHVRLVGGGGRDNALEGEVGRYGLRQEVPG